MAVEMTSSVFEIRILFDAKCPLCLREGRYLKRLDDGRGRIQLEDISSLDFDASKYGLDQESIEARIHGILPDGSVIEGVEVFARAYSAVGIGWIEAMRSWRSGRWLLDRLYLLFAKNRLRITGRAPKQCDVSNGSSASRRIPSATGVEGGNHAFDTTPPSMKESI
jgi:predicted DCC family thiol-disulfide oxidoreductase YuxK